MLDGLKLQRRLSNFALLLIGDIPGVIIIILILLLVKILLTMLYLTTIRLYRKLYLLQKRPMLLKNMIKQLEADHARLIRGIGNVGGGGGEIDKYS